MFGVLRPKIALCATKLHKIKNRIQTIPLATGSKTNLIIIELLVFRVFHKYACLYPEREM